jgi:hypothetical protein
MSKEPRGRVAGKGVSQKSRIRPGHIQSGLIQTYSDDMIANPEAAS